MLPAIGYGIRRENRFILDDPALNGVEITFEHADQPLRTSRFIGPQDYDYVSIHALELSVTSPERPPQDYLETLKAVAEENGAQAISDHLGFTRDQIHGVAMGHFAPPPYSQAALDVTSRNIEFLQNYFGGRPFFLENIAYLFRFQAEMSEAAFLRQLLERTGCGWLLDVTNVYANALNHGYDSYEFVRQVLPATGRVQMHLAGGFYDEEAGMYFDSHSEPIPQEVWDLYRFSLEQAGDKVEAVFIERDDNFPDEAGWRREVRQARQIAEEVEGRSCLTT